jgi:hypothetical protein
VDVRERWAVVLFVNGDTRTGIAEAEKALAQRLELEGPRSIDVAEALRRTGRMHVVASDPSGALKHFERALAIRALEPEGAVSAASDDLRLDMAVALHLDRQIDEATAALEQVVAWREENAPSRAACAERMLAAVLRSRGETGRATLLEQRAASR